MEQIVARGSGFEARWVGSPVGARHAVHLLALLALLIAAPGFADPTPTTAAPVSIRAWVTPKDVTIGDPIRYTVEVSAAAETEVLIPVLSGTLGDFSITDFGELPTRKENGRAIVTRWYTLTCFETGDHLVPKPKVQYRIPGEELTEAEGDEVLVGVKSLLAGAKNATDIRDIKPPEELPFDWRPVALVAAGIALFALLGFGFYYVLNRPRRQYVVPPPKPHEVALAALNKLRARRYIEEGRLEAYYIELSAITRRYLEDRFNVRAPEMTTEEFLNTAAGNNRLTPSQRRLLGEFLAQADLVKFARHLPTLKDSEAAYEAAKRFVEDTRSDGGGTAAREVEHAAA